MAILCSVRSLWAACLLLLVPRLSCQSLLCSVSLVSEIAFGAASRVARSASGAPPRPGSVGGACPLPLFWRWLNELDSSLAWAKLALAAPHRFGTRAGACLRLIRGVLLKMEGVWSVCAACLGSQTSAARRHSQAQFHSHESIWRHNDSARIKHSYHDVICAQRRWPLEHSHLWSTTLSVVARGRRAQRWWP